MLLLECERENAECRAGQRGRPLCCASQVVAACFMRLLPEYAVRAEVAGHGFE